MLKSGSKKLLRTAKLRRTKALRYYDPKETAATLSIIRRNLGHKSAREVAKRTTSFRQPGRN